MELQQPTLETRVLAIELPSASPDGTQQPTQLVSHAYFYIASESRAIIDYDSWILLINNALGLS